MVVGCSGGGVFLRGDLKGNGTRSAAITQPKAKRCTEFALGQMETIVNL